MIIQYYVKSVYGVDRLYVADPEQARAISALTGAKTLEARHVAALESLGFVLTQVFPPR